MPTSPQVKSSIAAPSTSNFERSGAIASVHSFAQSSIGEYFLWFLGLVASFCLTLILYRWPELRDVDPTIGNKDRYGAARNAVAASAAAVERIVAQGAPVYGINTGFGKLASVRIAEADLATLQRNIVLSHAAGVGEACPRAVVRLMLALKLASLGQGASGVRPATVALIEAMLRVDVLPVIPGLSVGAGFPPCGTLRNEPCRAYEAFTNRRG